MGDWNLERGLMCDEGRRLGVAKGAFGARLIMTRGIGGFNMDIGCAGVNNNGFGMFSFFHRAAGIRCRNEHGPCEGQKDDDPNEFHRTILTGMT